MYENVSRPDPFDTFLARYSPADLEAALVLTTLGADRSEDAGAKSRYCPMYTYQKRDVGHRPFYAKPSDKQLSTISDGCDDTIIVEVPKARKHNR